VKFHLKFFGAGWNKKEHQRIILAKCKREKTFINTEKTEEKQRKSRENILQREEEN
jgi:hypothetical protein